MAYFSIPRASCIGEYSLDGTANDTNDGTKTNGTATNLSYATTQVGYQKQHAVFGATSSFTRASLASIQTLAVAVYPTAASKTLFTYVTSTSLVTFDGSYVVSASGLTNSTIYVNNTTGTTLTANAWNLLIITHDAKTASNFNLGSSSFTGNACILRAFNAKLTETERTQLWHEFNRKLGGGSDFGAYIPAPTAHFEADGSNTFVDVAAQGTVTRTSGTATTDAFGITRAISAPNQSWSSISGDSFVFWNNSGWKLEKNATGVSATGINTANTTAAVLFFPAGVISTAQQTYIENLFKARYPYAFRRSIQSTLAPFLVIHIPGDTSNGLNFADISGNSNNATSASASTKTRAQQNTCVSLSGTDAQKATITSNAGNSLTALTICGWFKRDSSQSNDNAVLARKDSSSGTRYLYGFACTNSTNNLRVADYYDGSSVKSVDTTWNNGEWAFATETISVTDGQKGYKNARLVGSNSISSLTAPNTQWAIGGDPIATNQQFKGQWSNFMVFNKVLNSNEIQSLYYATYRN